jgi:hypothetical protein
MQATVIVRSRRQLAVPTIGAAGLTVVGALLIKNQLAIGALIAITFGTINIACLIQLIAPSRLEFSEEKLEYYGFTFQRQIIDWRDIGSFFIGTEGASTWIGYDFLPGHAPNNLTTMLNRLFGVDGHFGGGWSMPAKDLVVLLNRYRCAAIA